MMKEIKNAIQKRKPTAGLERRVYIRLSIADHCDYYRWGTRDPLRRPGLGPLLNEDDLW